MLDERNIAGTRLTCTNPDCACKLQIITPCPHGSVYTCACGHPFEATTDGPLADLPA